MSVIYAPHPWPSAAGSNRHASWVFGREIALGGYPGAPLGLQWRQLRNCSMTPRQLGLVYLSLCTVSLVIAAFFFVQGAPFVAAFAGVELLAFGIALLVFARHAGDRETLTLVGRNLQVERCIGSRVEHTDLAADWLRVEPAAGQGSLIELSARGQCVRVGRFLRPELRGAFASELRRALRRSIAATESGHGARGDARTDPGTDTASPTDTEPN